MTGTIDASTRARLPADERRSLIVREAGRLFGRHGYDDTRLEDVAAAAGVSKPIVYRHFESKQALYLALLARHEDDLPTFVEGLAPGPGDSPTALVSQILDGWLDYVHENSYAWLMLFRDTSGDEEIKVARRRVSLRAREVLADFIRVVAPETAPELVAPTAEFLTSGLAGLALWWIDHPEAPKDVVHAAATRTTAAILEA